MDRDTDSNKGNEDPLWEPSLTDNGLGNTAALRIATGQAEPSPGFQYITEFGFLGSFCDQGHELSLVKGEEGYNQKWVGHLPLFCLMPVFPGT